MEFKVSPSSRISNEKMKSSIVLDVKNYSYDSTSGKLNSTFFTTLFILLSLKAFLYTFAISTDKLGGRSK